MLSFCCLFSDVSTVFLSANSFVHPFEFLNHDISKLMIQSYVAYLKDDTRLINNPGIKVCTSTVKCQKYVLIISQS